MNTKKSVCPKCNDTGTENFKIGRYTYGRQCDHKVEPELPLDQETMESPEMMPSY